MSVVFPELVSFGTLLKFALSLEQTAEETSREAAEREACRDFREKLLSCAKKHKKRRQMLEQLRRERLNEVVLQPIEGMNHSEYIPDAALNGLSEVKQMLQQVVSVEGSAARFYDDAARIAASVLSGVERTFKKLALESRTLADTFRAEL